MDTQRPRDHTSHEAAPIPWITPNQGVTMTNTPTHQTTETGATYITTRNIPIDELTPFPGQFNAISRLTCGNEIKSGMKSAPTVRHHHRGCRPPMRAVTDMAEAICTAPDCSKPMHNRTHKLCTKHYQRLQRHGDVNVNKRVGPRPDTPIIAIPEQKKCSRCGQVKASTEFHQNIDRRCEPPRVRLKSACKSCCSDEAQKWRQHNPEKARKIDQRYLGSLRTKRRRKARTYGLDEFELAAMEASQQGHCLICKEFAEGGLVVDHDHSTGHVRGLLCGQCNLGLGAFRDNPKRLIAAILYLKAGSRGVFD